MTNTTVLIDAILADVTETIATQRLPVATYRLQLNADFTLRSASDLVEHLHQLGISHLYLSPIFTARRGSRHGYDVVRHYEINPEIGTLDDLRELAAHARVHGMGLILDVVPNHMCAIASMNPWWRDVLENGPSSSYAHYFDIDWMPLKPDLAHKVLLPILGDQFGRVLEDGLLRVTYDEGAFSLVYFDHSLPIAPRSYSLILSEGLNEFATQLGAEHVDYLELLSILTAIRNLPPRTETSAERLAERRREKEIIKRRLHELVQRSSSVAEFVSKNVTELNGQRGKSSTFNRLDELLNEQAYRLADWRVASDEINYRRFFDVNELAAICVEHPDVFEATHRFLFELLDEGLIDGLRIDHPDGLYDPAGYLRQLQQRGFLQLCRKSYQRISRSSETRQEFRSVPSNLVETPKVLATFATGEQTVLRSETRQEFRPVPSNLIEAPKVLATFATDEQPVLRSETRQEFRPVPESNSNAESLGDFRYENASSTDQSWDAIAPRLAELWNNVCTVPGAPLARPLYVVVEKILGRDESVPGDWLAHGTVGYDFLNATNGVFVDASSEVALTKLFHRFAGREVDFREQAYQCKRLIARLSMASEVSVLGYQLDRISESNRWSRDFTRPSLTRALQEVIASFGVYRTYVTSGRILDRDRYYIETAVARAKRRNPAMSESIFDFVRDLLLLKYRDNADEQEREAQRRFVGKFQQLTGPMMAKAIEDTVFYRFNRLVSLNEVGGEPRHYGTWVEQFHDQNANRLPRYGHGLLASSTHDTKRSEDARARINVLSELPREWPLRALKWARWNERFKTEVDGVLAPSGDDEYLLYQTLVGIWPTTNRENGGAKLAPQAAPLSPEDRDRLEERISSYMLKVARESKSYSSWINPHAPYEEALRRFIRGLFHVEHRRRPFLAEVAEFAHLVAEHGYWNSLSQTLLKITSPGVPDFFQGCEQWVLTLVDPDNRGCVDFDSLYSPLRKLREILATTEAAPDRVTARAALLEPLLADRASGRIKLFVTHLALKLRANLPDLFCVGDYVPLEASGVHADHLVAFARRHGHQVVLTVVPRLTVSLTGLGGDVPRGDIWQDTALRVPSHLEATVFKDLFTLETHHTNPEGLLFMKDLTTHFPMCCLYS